MALFVSEMSFLTAILVTIKSWCDVLCGGEISFQPSRRTWLLFDWCKMRVVSDGERGMLIWTGVSVGVSVFTLVTISMERYFAICRPLTSLRWQTRRHACRTICVAWVVALLVMTPTAIYQRLLRMPSGGHKCAEIWDDLYLEKVYACSSNVEMLPSSALCTSLAVVLAWDLVNLAEWSPRETLTEARQSLYAYKRSRAPYQINFINGLTARTLQRLRWDDKNKECLSSSSKFLT